MGIELSFAERRVLGVLIEKGFTTPEGYPLTLNGVMVASNQKTCRDPVTSLEENEVLESLESLRTKGFAVLVRSEGARADRWKHRAAERLEVEPRELAILAELLLRGPQTDGELRQRATRMVPLGDLAEVDRILAGLAERPEPLVERLSAEERKRGAKYAHTLYPPSERPEGAREGGGAPSAAAPAARAAPPGLGAPEAAPAAPVRDGAPPARPQVPSPAPAPVPGSAAATPPVSPEGIISELLRRVRALEERVEELEATFVKFLR